MGEMWFGVCIAVAMELVPIHISSTAVSLYLFIINIVGGNLNLLLPWLQRSIGLRISMVLLFPGAYFLAAILFALAGFSWNLHCVKQSTAEVDDVRETSPLIQNDDNSENDSLTESQDLHERIHQQSNVGGVISLYQPDKRSRLLSVSYTAPSL